MSQTTITSIEDLLFNMQKYKDSNNYTYPIKSNLLPSSSVAYDIDLDTRTVKVPSILSVQYDHNAEIIYFKCARYYDNVDLTSTVCIVEYVNANGDAGLYWVPYVDVEHYDVTEDKDGNEIPVPVIYIPWCVNGLATAYPGEVKFVIRFYKLSDDGQTYIYNLSTKPATGQVLHGMDLTDDDTLEVFKLESSVVNQLNENIQSSASNATTYWVDAV